MSDNETYYEVFSLGENPRVMDQVSSIAIFLFAACRTAGTDIVSTLKPLLQFHCSRDALDTANSDQPIAL